MVLKRYRSPYNELKSIVSKRMNEVPGVTKIYNSLKDGHPNYSNIYVRWKDLHNIE
jgi:hypothetical protein